MMTITDLEGIASSTGKNWISHLIINIDKSSSERPYSCRKQAWSNYTFIPRTLHTSHHTTVRISLCSLQPCCSHPLSAITTNLVTPEGWVAWVTGGYPGNRTRGARSRVGCLIHYTLLEPCCTMSLGCFCWIVILELSVREIFDFTVGSLQALERPILSFRIFPESFVFVDLS